MSMPLTTIEASLAGREMNLCPVCGEKIKRRQLVITLSQAGFHTIASSGWNSRYVVLHRDCLRKLAELTESITVDSVQVMARLAGSYRAMVVSHGHQGP